MAFRCLLCHNGLTQSLKIIEDHLSRFTERNWPSTYGGATLVALGSACSSAAAFSAVGCVVGPISLSP